MTAGPYPAARRAGVTQWAGIDLPDRGQQPGRVAFMDRLSLVRREVDAVEVLGREVVDQKPLHGHHHLADVAPRQFGVIDGREPARCGVVVERLLSH